MTTISIKKIIDVSSILPSATIGRRNFARANFIQKGNGFTEPFVRNYSSSSEVLEDLGSNSEAYKASLKYFAGGFNGIKPTQFFVGLVNTSGLTSSTQGFFTSGDASANLASFQAVADGEFSISKDGSTPLDVTAIDFTSTTSLIDVATVLQERIRLASDLYRNITVTFDGTSFIFTSETYGSTSSFEITTLVGTGTDLTGATYLDGGVITAGISGTLADVITAFLQDNRYYHVILSNQWTDQEILEWSSSIEAATKITYMLWALSTDSDIADEDVQTDTSTVAKTLFDRKATKTVLIYDATNTDYKQASLPSYFGVVDFTGARPLGALAFKQFSGITATILDDSQYENLRSKNTNFYSVFGEVGRDIAYSGQVSAGNFIHDIITADYIDYNMTYNIFDLMINLPRLSYTTADFAKLYQAIELAYIQAVSAAMIAGGTDPDTGEEYLNGYTINIPAPEDIPSADKQAGVIKGITTIGLLSGSAIKFVITNTLKL
jgi:hypothetical protein